MKTKPTLHLTAAMLAVGALVGLLIVAFGWQSWLGYYLDVCEALQVTPTILFAHAGRLVIRSLGLRA